MPLDAQTLVDWLVTNGGVDAKGLTPTAPLFSDGALDSLLLLELIAFIEASCDFTVSWTEVTLENLDTIERILAYAERGGSV